MITSAQILATSAQKDGRSWVIEQQTDDTLGPQLFTYLAPAGADANAIMTARTATINAAIAATPTITITQDDGTTNTLQTYAIPSSSLQLTAGQKSAMTTARTVLLALKPFLRVYQTLTPAQQQFVLTHSPWVQQALDVIYGS